MQNKYKISRFFSEFRNPDIEQRFRNAEFTVYWLAALLVLSAFAELLTFIIVDTKVFAASPFLRNQLMVSHGVLIAIELVLLAVHAVRPSVKKNDNIALLFVLIFSVKYAWTALFYSEHVGRTNNPFIFAVVTLLTLTVIPFSFKRSLVGATGMIAAAVYVNVGKYLAGGDPVSLFSFLIMMCISVAFGAAFSYYVHRSRRERFAHAEIAERLAVQLGEEVERRKEAEARLVDQNERLEQMVAEKVGRLRESEFRFRTLVQTLPGVVIQLNGKGEVEECNRLAEQMFSQGTPLLGLAFSKRFFVKSDADRFDNVCTEVLLGKKREVIETMNSSPTGDVRFFSWSIAATHREDGTASVVAVGQDVTMLKSTQQLMIQSEKMLSLGGLAAGLAHELNSPLAGVLQSIQVIKQRLDENSRNEEVARRWNTSMTQIIGYLTERRVMELCETIENASVRSSTIIRDMLDFARQRNRRTVEQMSELLDSAIRLAETDYNLKKNFHFKDIHIDKRYESKRFCKCDKTALSQVFFNILVNGAHAMAEVERPREQSKFEICTSDKAEAVEIVIRDNGPGIEQEKLSRIFEPFFTTKEAGKGTGLGLSISYYIITEGHQGTISAVSQMGKGTSFIIRVPFE